MRTLTALPLLVLAAACADAGMVQPVPEDSPDLVLLADAPGTKVPGGWEFFTQVTFVGTLEPGETRITPSGVMHVKDLVNLWLMNGDLNGSWYFQGDVNLNLNNGMGRSRSLPMLAVIEASPWGTGTFECNASFKVENYPDAFTQSGVISGCHGTGDFEGKRMKGYLTNEANPGFGGPDAPYDFRGVIW